MVHSLVIRVRLTAADRIPIFLERFEPVHHVSNTAEPDTKSYEIHAADDCDRTLVILERFTRREHVVSPHGDSAEFKTFIAWLGEHVVAKNEDGSAKAEQAATADGVAPFIEDVDKKELNDETTHSQIVAFRKARLERERKAEGETPSEVRDGMLVFCGFSSGKDPIHAERATLIGKLIAEKGLPLVYGGGSLGIMGAVASSAEKHGSTVVSVIPRTFVPESGNTIGILQTCGTMNDRKAMMFRQSKYVIALPGGLGTLDEFFEVITLCQLNAYRPKIGLLNTNNYYGTLMDLLQHVVDSGFAAKEIMGYFVLEEDPAKLVEKVLAFEPLPPSLDFNWGRDAF